MDRIRKLGDPVLKTKSRPVKRVTAAVRDLLDDMVKVVTEVPGIGLAAPQLGVDRRVIVVLIQDLIELINPEVVRTSGESTAWEGCLSYPGYAGLVTRPARVEVKGIDRNGRPVWIEGEGLLARALLHEIDHLDGIMFIDRAEEVITQEELDRRIDAARLRVVGIGSADFALPTLEALRACHRLELVITQPDRRAGRGRKPAPPPVKVWADEHEVPVLQPERIGDSGVLGAIEELQPDLLVVAAYGQIIPLSLLEAARLGALNVHGSLLPEYRGAAPIQRAIMAGDDQTGVTIMWMDEGMDTGDIATQCTVPIRPDDTAGTLSERMARIGAELLLETLELVTAGGCPRIKQDDSIATSAPRITSRDEVIDWREPAAVVDRLVRGLAPRPGAYTSTAAGRLKIYRGRPVPGDGGLVPGQARVEDDQLLVDCGADRYSVEELQLAGARRMTAGQFINGYRAVLDEPWGREQT